MKSEQSSPAWTKWNSAHLSSVSSGVGEGIGLETVIRDKEKQILRVAHVRSGGDNSGDALRVAGNRIIALRVTNADILVLKLVEVPKVKLLVCMYQDLPVRLDTDEHCGLRSEFQEMIWAKVALVLLMMLQHVSPGLTE